MNFNQHDVNVIGGDDPLDALEDLEDDDAAFMNFVGLVRHTVKPECFDNFRHYMSQSMIYLDDQPGCVARYLMTRIDDTKERGEIHREDGAARRVCSPGDSTRGIEVYIYMKWESKAAFDEHFNHPFVFQAASYSLEVDDMFHLPEMSMWEKVNGMHREAVLGMPLWQMQGPLPPLSTNSKQTNNDNSDALPRKNMYAMIHQRTVNPLLGVNPVVLLQTMNRLAELSVQAEPQQCLSYDILTSRYVGPDYQEDMIETAVWRSKDDYLRHMEAPYVKQSEAVNPAFKEGRGPTFWEITPDGLLESNPNIDFMAKLFDSPPSASEASPSHDYPSSHTLSQAN